MCKWGTEEIVAVRIPADLSHTGSARWKDVGIDACIAPIVRALQQAGIDMRGSCCGHGKGDGSIDLADGRTLVIKTPIVARLVKPQFPPNIDCKTGTKLP